MVASFCMFRWLGSASKEEFYWSNMTANAKRSRKARAGSGAWLVTDLIRLIKLTNIRIIFFGHPSAEPIVKIKGLFENEPVWRPFSPYKIAQNRAKSCKNVQKMTGNLGFSRPILLKGVKSRGSCQAAQSTGDLALKTEN